MCVCIYYSLRCYGGKEGGREGGREGGKSLPIRFGVDGWLGGVVCREGGREGRQVGGDLNSMVSEGCWTPHSN